MSTNYYYLVAGLNDILFDSETLSYSVAEYKEEIYPLLTDTDKWLVNLVFQQYDQKNLLTMLQWVDSSLTIESLLQAEPNCSPLGEFTIRELAELIVAAKSSDRVSFEVPSYIYEFLTEYFSSENTDNGILWEDRLQALFYRYALGVNNSFIASWYRYNLNIKNVITAYTARRHSLDATKYIIGDGDVADALRLSTARDWGVSTNVELFDELISLLENENLSEREKGLDRLRWRWLEENSFFSYFSIEQLFVFLQKVMIMERWTKLDKEHGQQLFRQLINDLKSGVEIPTE